MVQFDKLHHYRNLLHIDYALNRHQFGISVKAELKFRGGRANDPGVLPGISEIFHHPHVRALLLIVDRDMTAIGGRNPKTPMALPQAMGLAFQIQKYRKGLKVAATFRQKGLFTLEPLLFLTLV